MPRRDVAAAWLSTVLLWLCHLLTDVGSVRLEVVNEWTTLDWTRSGPGYDPSRAVPVSFEVTDDRLFMAVPRLYEGLPASLAVLPRNRPGRAILSPKLTAWPSERWHRADGNCSDTIVNAFRMRVDRCNRLWVLDCGVRDTFQTFTVQCSPKILVFDLATDTLVRRILVPDRLLRRHSLLTNLVLNEDVSSVECDHGLKVYMSDSSSPSVIVYDPQYDAMWRVQHPLMYPDPNHGLYTVEGESFTLMDGILGLAVSPPSLLPKRLFFQPFASDAIFSVETAALDQGPNTGDDSDLPVKVEGRKSSQAAGMIFDPRDSSLYFSPVTEEAIVSWVPGTDSPRLVARNRELMQFVLDLRSPPSDSHNIWMISTKLHKFVKQSVDPSVPHIRIIRILPDDPIHQYHNNTIY